METRCRTDGLILLVLRSRSSKDAGKLLFFSRHVTVMSTSPSTRFKQALQGKKPLRLGISLDSILVLKKPSEGWDPRGLGGD